ncbi:MAG: hypothetical protein ABI580_03540 [Burkholderiaceae bacterium]
MNEENQPRNFVRTPATDEVMRRIGRNVVNFQLVETMLKHLNVHSSLHGPASQLATRMDEQRAAVDKKTMGELAGMMMSKVLQPQQERETPDEIDEPWFGFRFTVETDAQFIDQHDKEMRSLVDARNELIHHFLPRWYSAVDGDSEAALAYLEDQMHETFRVMDRLRGWVRATDEGRKQVAEFWTSPEGQRQMTLSFLQGSSLVAMLGEIALRAARADGWAYLTTALNLIKREAPDELDALQKRYGHRNLKGVLLAAEFFDVLDEPLAGGSTRTLYRINDRYELKLTPDTEPETRSGLALPASSQRCQSD